MRALGDRPTHPLARALGPREKKGTPDPPDLSLGFPRVGIFWSPRPQGSIAGVLLPAQRLGGSPSQLTRDLGNRPELMPAQPLKSLLQAVPGTQRSCLPSASPPALCPAGGPGRHPINRGPRPGRASIHFAALAAIWILPAGQPAAGAAWCNRKPRTAGVKHHATSRPEACKPPPPLLSASAHQNITPAREPNTHLKHPAPPNRLESRCRRGSGSGIIYTYGRGCSRTGH